MEGPQCGSLSLCRDSARKKVKRTGGGKSMLQHIKIYLLLNYSICLGKKYTLIYVYWFHTFCSFPLTNVSVSIGRESWIWTAQLAAALLEEADFFYVDNKKGNEANKNSHYQKHRLCVNSNLNLSIYLSNLSIQM